MRQTSRLFYGLTLALVLGSPAAAQDSGTSVLEQIRKQGSLTIAHRESSVPFSFLDADKKPVGYAVDICLKVAEAVKKQLALKDLTIKYRQVSGADRIQVVASRQAELECGSTTNNAERREKVAFTVPHYITGARFLVKADSPIRDIADFEGRRLVSTKGTTPLKAVTKINQDRLLKMKVLEAPDHAAAVAMVENGEADGFAMDDVLLFGLRASRPNPNALKVVGKLLTIEPLAIMLPKDDAAFKRVVDEELKRLIRSGEAQALYERWFMKPIPPKNTALNLPMNYLLKEFWKYPTDVVPN